MKMQKITLENKNGEITATIEGGYKISKKEKERIQKEWEKPENQEKLKELVETYGEYKKVTDQKTGKAYRVPTMDIITKGLDEEALKQYPLWPSPTRRHDSAYR